MKPVFAVSLLLLAAPALADGDPVRNVGSRYDAAKLTTVALDFPVGEVEIDGWDKPEVAVEMELRCQARRRERCEEAAKKVKLIAGGAEGEHLRFRVEGFPKGGNRGLEATLRLHVPASLPVTAELGVGEMRIEGLTGGLTADVGVGELDITLPEAAIASVRLDAGIGEAVLRTREKRYTSSGVGAKTLRWAEGTGRAAVRVDVGVGEARVALR